MKKLLLLAALCLSAVSLTMAQGKVSAKYNADDHTLTLNAKGASIDEVLDALAKENIQLFFADLDKEFTVNVNATNEPLDDVLEKFIPTRYHYFYRIDSQKGEQAIAKALRRAPTAQKKQEGAKAIRKTVTLNQDPTDRLLVSAEKFRLRPVGGEKDASITGRLPSLPGQGKMLAIADIKERQLTQVQLQQFELAQIDEPDEHLVVIFKVTKDGIEQVSASYEDGAYVPQDENTAAGEHLLLGSNDRSEVVYLETFEDPLESRAIYDPSINSPGGVFKMDEGYIRVKMPKNYADAVQTRALKFELAKFQTAEIKPVFEKMRLKQLRKTDLTQSIQLLRPAKTIDLSKLRIQPRKR